MAADPTMPVPPFLLSFLLHTLKNEEISSN